MCPLWWFFRALHPSQSIPAVFHTVFKVSKSPELAGECVNLGRIPLSSAIHCELRH